MAESGEPRAPGAEPRPDHDQAAEHVWFLEAMDALERALRSSDDLESMLMNMLEATRQTFGADRSWASTPLDPDAQEIEAPFVCSVPEFALPPQPKRLPVLPTMADGFRRVLASDGPICAGEGLEVPLEPVVAKLQQIRSLMMVAVRPSVGPAWGLGLHQCSSPRRWTRAECRLFQEMGRRFGDALSTLLKHRELEASEGRFRALFEQGADAVFVFDEQARLIDVNSQACAQTGRTRAELLQLEASDVLGPAEETSVPLWEAYGSKPRFIVEQRLYTVRGEPIPVEISASRAIVSGKPALIAVARDLSARKRAEREQARLQEQLRHAQKMEAIGRLAGGVAHDFNNLLTAIQGNVEFALHQVEQRAATTGIVDDLEQALLAVERATRLTRQLLVFARRETVSTRSVDLNQTVENIGTMLRRLLPETIAIETSLGRDLHLIRGDVGQLEQLLVNLAVNARDAMPEGGRLRIETANVEVDEVFASQHAEAHPGSYVVLTIGDTGVGIAPDVAPHIFEPFFSTKPPGHGTGLGLATCDTVVRQHGGFFVFHTAVGQGTTFQVFLPALNASTTTSVSLQPHAAVDGGHETILLCEDDASVGRVAQRILGAAGYEVLVAPDGRAGLELAARHPGPIDLLVSDVIMPEMNGKQLADVLRQSRPELRVLYVSGYTSNLIIQPSAADPSVGFLAKPYTPRALLAKVRETLDAPPSTRTRELEGSSKAADEPPQQG